MGGEAEGGAAKADAGARNDLAGPGEEALETALGSRKRFLRNRGRPPAAR